MVIQFTSLDLFGMLYFCIQVLSCNKDIFIRTCEAVFPKFVDVGIWILYSVVCVVLKMLLLWCFGRYG